MGMFMNEFGPDGPEGQVIEDLFGGGGGSKSVIAVAAVAVAAHSVGIRKYRYAGGVSGGTIVPSLIDVLSAPEALQVVIDTPFESLMTPLTNKARIIWAHIMRECYWKRHDTSGVISAHKVGQFVSRYNDGKWPKNFWTPAVVNRVPRVYTPHGVFEMQEDGSYKELPCKLPPIELIIEGSCAVPGFIQAPLVEGELLQDGALTPYGRTPLTIAKQLLQSKPGALLACDVGEDPPDNRMLVRFIRWLFCGSCCDPLPEPPLDSEGVVLVQPRFKKIKALEFSYTADQKMGAVLETISETIRKFEQSGRFAPEVLAKPLQLAAQCDALNSLTTLKEGELAIEAQHLLYDFGLYPLKPGSKSKLIL